MFCYVQNIQETQGVSTLLKHWALCGKNGRCNDELNNEVFDYNVPHEVRCCSDVAKDGWSKRAGCTVWTESSFDSVCYASKNFLEAECICGKHDGRVCTKEEIDGNCSQGTGCGFDREVVWTSTDEPASIGEQCASETQGVSTLLKHWALCGKNGRCNDELNNEVFDYNVPHEVRCCSDVAKDGWSKRAGCTVWTESSFDSVCYASKNFLEAECICGKHDGRVCTKEEIEGNCSQGTGCGFDREVVWTSTDEPASIGEQCASETQGVSTLLKEQAVVLTERLYGLVRTNP